MRSQAQSLLDAWCERFELAWREGSAELQEFIASISDAELSRSGVTRRELITELVMIDLEYQWRCLGKQVASDDLDDGTTQRSRVATEGRPPTVEWYVQRFPELGSISQVSGELIAQEYYVRWRWGDRPTRAEFFRRFGKDHDALTDQLNRIDLELRGLMGSVAKTQLRCPNCREMIPENDDRGSSDGLACPNCRQEIRLIGARPIGDTESDMGVTRRLAHFELLQPLGSGAFGVVWKARDTKLDRIVAVKVARRSQWPSGDAETFLREARAAAQLSHPHIVAVHEAGRDGDTVYLVCDYIAGTTLDQWAKDHQPTARKATQLCLKMAVALEHAHQAGVIHRDLKPGNIMMDATDEPRLMDFGLARRELGEVTMTVEGQILGTPAYMSPEQAVGQSHQADGRSDIYSLGVVFFELLTGVRPFQGNVRMLLKQIVEDDAPSPRKFADRLPKDLETICMKCLEKSASRRFDSARELADELRRYLQGEPILSRPISRIERGIRWCRRKPLVASIAVLVLLLFGAALAAGYQGLLTEAARRDALTARVDAIWTTEISAMPILIQSLEPYPPPLQRRVEAGLADAVRQEDQDRMLRARMALVRADPTHVSSLSKSLRHCTLAELQPIAWTLSDAGLADDYWAELQHPSRLDGPEFLRICAALVAWRGAVEGWNAALTVRLADELLAQDIPDIIRGWRRLFAPLGPQLAGHLCGRYPLADAGNQDKIIYFLEYALVDYHDAAQGSVSVQDLVSLLCHTEEHHYSRVRRMALKQHTVQDLVDATKRRVISACSNPEDGLIAAKGIEFLANADGPAHLWTHLRHSPDPNVRSFLISRLRPEIIAAEELAAQLVSSTEVSVRRAILLSLGHYPPMYITAEIWERVIMLYREDPDPGIHSAAFWTLQKWGRQPPQLAPMSPGSNRPGWFVNHQQQTMVMLPAARFVMGSPADEKGRKGAPEDCQKADIAADFAIAITEVTVEEFRRFKPGHFFDLPWAPSPSCPVGRVSVRLARDYCNWLSQQDGLPQSEWCFPSDPAAELPEDSLHCRGYRLPTSAEWEYACRAGTTSPRFFGQDEHLLQNYSWYVENSGGISHPVAALMPNDWGLFDLYGNAWERTMDTTILRGSVMDVLRSETVEDWPNHMRSAMKTFARQGGPSSTAVGLRVARTLSRP